MENFIVDCRLQRVEVKQAYKKFIYLGCILHKACMISSYYLALRL